LFGKPSFNGVNDYVAKPSGIWQLNVQAIDTDEHLGADIHGSFVSLLKWMKSRYAKQELYGEGR
jgi:hypothetical protein